MRKCVEDDVPRMEWVLVKMKKSDDESDELVEPRRSHCPKCFGATLSKVRVPYPPHSSTETLPLTFRPRHRKKRREKKRKYFNSLVGLLYDIVPRHYQDPKDPRDPKDPKAPKGKLPYRRYLTNIPVIQHTLETYFTLGTRRLTERKAGGSSWCPPNQTANIWN